MSTDPLRLAGALLLVALYLAMCALIRRGRPAPVGAPAQASDWLVAYASQSGTGEQLAMQTLATLQTGGLAARAISFEQLDTATLAGATHALFIASTYGEGDAPDSAALFTRVLEQVEALPQLHYGLMALGDSSYTHYCGFGRFLDGALQARGARPLFARIEVDRAAPAAITAWQHHLSHLIGTSDAADWSAPAFGEWVVESRHLTNPGSAGAPVYRVRLRPLEGALPAWQAGDLAQLRVPQEPDLPREYSIASISAEGWLELLVRLHVREDGSGGLASSFLCLGAPLGQGAGHVALRLRAHTRFRQGDNASRPLILIGNGTGMAGLRPHLASRALADGPPCWLLFGERQREHDFFYQDQLVTWQAGGPLDTLSLAFSRDEGAVRYVQHALLAEGPRLHAWLARGAAIYVCGSLHGMGEGVHAALIELLGENALAQLSVEGRYRRDVY
ncbi:MAG: sulfite reductase subunit alpha [Massilia sp.]